MNAQRTADVYAARLARGCCVTCDQPNPAATWRCAGCEEHSQELARTRRIRRQEAVHG